VKSYYGHAQRFLLVVQSGKFAKLASELLKRIFSNSESYLLRRDRTVPFQADLERFRPFFDGELRNLRKDEVLLEFAYTFELFRGQKIMPAAMAAIAEKGLLSGARYAVTYVQKDNIAALKGCAAAGFSPFMIRNERWRIFSFKESFSSLPDGLVAS
jgi:hypothetical protein